MLKNKARSVVAGLLLFSAPAAPASAERLAPMRPLPEDVAQLAHENQQLPCGREATTNPKAHMLPNVLGAVGLQCVAVPRDFADEAAADVVVTQDGLSATTYSITKTQHGTELSAQLIMPINLLSNPQRVDEYVLYSNDVVHVDICNYRYEIVGNDLNALAGGLRFLQLTTGTTCW